MNASQTDKRLLLGALCIVGVGLSACIRTVEAQTPPDAGTAAMHDAGSRDAHAPHTTVHRPSAGLGDGNRGRGFFYGEPSPQCISEAAAQTQALDSARQGPPGSGMGGSIIGLRPNPRPEPPAIGRCPPFIWTWVGAGHGAEPVGSVQAPIALPATRAARRRTHDACCYLIPSSPGSPLG